MTTFDFDLFALSVASQLLGSLQHEFINNSSDTIHWYWRSKSFTNSSCIWIDSSWEIQHDRIIWKLGCLRNDATDGGVYVQSDALHETNFRHFFHQELGIVIDSSPTIGLAQTFATALLHTPSSNDPTNSTNAIPLFFSDLDTTAAFSLVTDTAGTRTPVAPVLLSRLQYIAPPFATDAKSSSTLEEFMKTYQAWKAQSASLKQNNAISPPVDKHGTSPEARNEPKKPNVVKRSSVHGYSKIQPRSRKKAGLKFMGQG